MRTLSINNKIPVWSRGIGSYVILKQTSCKAQAPEKTYATLLKGKPSRKVRVAVIDSGIDVEHEDLKRLIWTNRMRFLTTALIDDKNGYVDDIHGWNFIGGKEGSVNEDTYEVTREYIRLKPLYDSIDEKKIKKKDKAKLRAMEKGEGKN